ncbi:hypothetical protein Ccrd_021571 [Cynara cardunculus var. scolymus]|uniref:Uncharacterized protein n=1 Tax=Cynara cardunculus var. scolymus TaxID=59895 RepID=A0A103Y079_CYNCS|nr:hypothetical protein Ccrd_021571 [Cynara cardunculus var. scolymus]
MANTFADHLQSDEASSSMQSNKRGSTDYKKVRKEMSCDR